MEELLRKVNIFFAQKAANITVPKTEKDYVYSKKKQIIKNVYEKSSLFKKTIENFDKVEYYYFVISNYNNFQDGEIYINLNISVYLNDYKFLKELFEEEKKSIIKTNFDLVDANYDDPYVFNRFKIKNLDFGIQKHSINIEWHNMIEEEKLDAYYEFIRDDDVLYSHGCTFNVVLKNFQHDLPNPDKRKKLYLPLNTRTKTYLQMHKKSFIKNDYDFYKKYKLLFDDDL